MVLRRAAPAGSAFNLFPVVRLIRKAPSGIYTELQTPPDDRLELPVAVARRFQFHFTESPFSVFRVTPLRLLPLLAPAGSCLA
jgi:hypothetical protein